MGPISKKLGRRFAKWSGQFRQSARTVPIPKDVRDVGTLVKDGHDPLHAVYISVQNITSVFAECVSVLPELEPYYDVVAAAEDEYMPSGPPMSPLTGSYFTTWAFFDFRFTTGTNSCSRVPTTKTNEHRCGVGFDALDGRTAAGGLRIDSERNPGSL